MNKRVEIINCLQKVVLVACAYWCIWSWKQIVGLYDDLAVYSGGMYFGYNLWSVVLFILDIYLIRRLYI